MAVKSILDIEINDGAFRTFQAMYDRYDRMLKGAPGHWQQVTGHINRSRAAFEALVHQQISSLGRAKLIAEAEKEAARRTGESAKSWREIARDSTLTVRNVTAITASLLRWGALSSVATGLLGIGGLFGLDRLGEGAAGARRSSLGLGVSPGEQRAFQLNYSRFVDPQQVLQGVSAALHDVTSKSYVGLLSAGLGQGFLQRNNAADVSVALLRKIPQLFAGTPQQLIGARLKSLGLDELLSQRDVIRTLASPPGERAGQEGAYRRDVGRLDQSGGTGLAWQNFVTQMQRAGSEIESVLIRQLVGLAGPLEKLSKSFVRAVESFEKSGALEQWVESFGRGIETFAKYVGTEEFQQGVKDFAEGVIRVGKALNRVAGWVVGSSPEHSAERKASSDRVAAIRQRQASGVSRWTTLAEAFTGKGEGREGAAAPIAGGDDAAVRALAKELRGTGAGSITELAAKYSGTRKLNQEGFDQYVGAVSKRAGIADNAQINLSDPETLAKLVAAIRSADTKRDVSTKAVVEILNNTGGNAVISTSQAPR